MITYIPRSDPGDDIVRGLIAETMDFEYHKTV